MTGGAARDGLAKLKLFRDVGERFLSEASQRAARFAQDVVGTDLGIISGRAAKE